VTVRLRRMTPTAEERALLRHFLGAIAYRAQKAVRGAPESFGGFTTDPPVRTPAELVRHMTSVVGYAATFFDGGTYRPEPLETFAAEIERFHRMLAQLGERIDGAADWSRLSPQQLLQGPLADAMTHAGQLAMLRRLAGIPVPPENFIFAQISGSSLGSDQPEPAAPDAVWPEKPRTT
jgi:hypothetical protein